MNRASAVEAVGRSFALIGLSVEGAGFWYAPMHHLRKTMSSWLLETVPASLLASLSYSMGHRAPLALLFQAQASRTTLIDYKDRPNEESAERLLRTDRRKLLQWAAQGHLTVTTSSKSKRVNRGPGMTEPGGGYRFNKAEIDYLVELSADRFSYQDRFLTIGQAAEVLGCEESKVRRLIDLGESNGGIDGWTHSAGRGERYADPASVERDRIAHTVVPLAAAAAGLNRSTAWILAQIKLGNIRMTTPSRRADGQRSIYLTDYQALGGTADVAHTLARQVRAA